MVGVWAAVAAGRFVSPTYLPVDRLIENATAYVREHPKDADAYYTLGRIHYLAFINKSFEAATFGGDTPAHIIPFWWGENYLYHAQYEEAKRLALEEFGYASTQDVPQEKQQEFWNRVSSIEFKLQLEHWQPPQPTEEQLVSYAGAAQWNFYKAISLDPNNALYYLGQASLGEQYLEYLQEKCPALLPPAVRSIFLDGIKQTYWIAYQFAIEKDLILETLPIEGLGGLIGYEAGSAYVRLWEAQGQIPADVQERLTTIKANLKTLEALPRGAITPIVFSMEPISGVVDLLAPQRIVRFDLDGDGVVERRPWLKPTTGLLVWDADGEGRITSGRELFGSVTWWLFFSNGYRALDMLDDNRDGSLAGGELRGISVWFDRDCDGESDSGEVVSLESLGIVAIGTRPTGRDGKMPMDSAGIRLRDGRTLPSYDWIAPPAGRASPKPRQSSMDEEGLPMPISSSRF
jgi:hypothetical protein